MRHFISKFKVGQKLKIGDDVEIVVFDAWRGTVELAILAPEETKLEKIRGNFDSNPRRLKRPSEGTREVRGKSSI